MPVRRLTVQDQSTVVAFLQGYLESSLFLLHNIARGGMEFAGRTYQAEYIGAFREGALIGLAAQTWLGTCLLQAPYQEALNLLEVAWSRFFTRPLQGLLGPRTQCEEMIERLSLDRTSASLDQDEPLYVLDLKRLRTKGAISPDTQVRLARAPEVPMLITWRRDYWMEAMAANPGYALDARAREEITRAAAERRLFVLEARERLIGMGLYNAVSDEAVQVGGLWVPEPYRGKGLGRSLLAGILAVARDERGHHEAVALVHDANLPALNVCEHLGFKRSDRYSFTLWEPSQLPEGH